MIEFQIHHVESLMYRVFGVEGFGCQQCGEVMMLPAVSMLPPLAMTLLRAMNWRVRRKGESSSERRNIRCGAGRKPE